MKLPLHHLCGLLLLLSGSLGAQRALTGTVTDAADPLIGATVMADGTTVGTVTDYNGYFELTVPDGVERLLITYTGYQAQYLPITAQSEYDVVLQESALDLSEVVVTALGVKREKKSLGYAVQDLGADAIEQTRSTNVVNGLSGKVAGLQVSAANVPGGGSQVTIRGNSSVLGNNQPLYVIDGVPMEGDFAAPIDGASDNNVYGGGISEISPDNIASITVLKGANAAALYGSRAANGVILVTTKNGSQAEGLTISYAGSYSVENPFVVPEFQNIYGGGTGGVTWYADGRNGGITDPLAVEQFRNVYPDAPLVGTAGVDESWGAPMDGRLVRHWWTGTELAPLVPVPDSWSNFWDTGTTANNTLSISNNYGSGNFRFSFGRVDTKGLLYNNDYERNNFRLNIDQELAPKLRVQVSSEYIKSGSDNRQQPALWELGTWHHRHDDWGLLRDYADYMDVHIVREGDAYPYANWQHSFAGNRFYEQEYLTNANEKDRLLGNIAFTYEFLPSLSLLVRGGTDLWTDTRRAVTRGERIKSGTERTQSFSEDVLRRQETNLDFILTYNGYFGEDFSLNAQFGGNHRTNYFKRNYIGVNDATINGLYNVANNASQNTNVSRIEEKEVNSFFGAASFGYKSFLYLDVTARNDWSSTLPVENNSYFYPSVSLSGVLTDALPISGRVLSYAKVRAGWAQVGSDTDPYRLRQVFAPSTPWNSTTPLFAEQATIASSDLRPERTTGKEAGLDLRFLGGRIGLDVTAYEQTTEDQIINIAVSRATGYESKLINAGKVRNRGVEVVLSGAVIDLPKFGWDVALNYAKNNNTVLELYTDESGNELETIVLQSRRGLSLEARVGEPFGTLFGSGFARVEEGPLAGEVIFENGVPVKDPNLKVLGNVTPDWIGGVRNMFRLGAFSANFLIDAKIGGDIAEESSSIGMQTGVYPLTAIGREEGVIGVGARNVGDAENPVYVVNDVVAPTRDVVGALSVRYANEGAIFDASFVKLREAGITYALPAALVDRVSFLRAASVSLIGRNLAMLYSNHSQVDPEFNSYGGNLQGALNYTTVPSTRSFGVNLNLTF
ncbi:TonB-linked SusC/RagA family outer membrane protein [Lewinella marina]|uniref:SusC/RagA family TonB-linked outer membrane protein n=1 Tax=Neolewinella marina TaxID=438751 RepID=A0A2G0CE27_9BACT|nr:SusC/RagA family TonB-linked outer membrane protein [Neolewinella marina]NJB87457.1 TonB-linked SusC/RagA family outer membrane protein [Neolewinella marina]PHK98234.1 SusC/RagA family TonB-linked outer membrane protein [Neolewinella marina]